MENFKLETRIELFKEVFSYLTQGEKEEQLFEMVACANSWDGSLEEYRTYSMDELDDFLCGLTPSDVLNAVDKDFNLNDDYFKDTIYGLESLCDYDVRELILDNSDEIIETVLSDERICSQVDWLGDDLAETIACDTFDFSAGDKVMVESCLDGSVETVIKPVFNESEDEIFYQLSDGSKYPSDELSRV